MGRCETVEVILTSYPLGFSAKKESDNEEEKKIEEATIGWQRAQASRSNSISLVHEGSTMVKRRYK